MKPVLVGRSLTLEDLEDVALHRRTVELDESTRAKVDRAREAIEAIARAGDAAKSVYGVNTGFGALSETRIAASDILDLQKNLVRSHSCGVGVDLNPAEVRGMMLLRAQVLALGHSGVRGAVIELLLEMLNRGVHPRIPSQGSVGASGDLAPLAHLALVMMGEGHASLGCDPYISGADALRKAGLTPLVLQAKEGLALINGTQFMTSLGALALLQAERLCTVADIAGAMSLEALKGTTVPFDARLQAARPHPGQASAAGNLRTLLTDSGIAASHKDCGKVQDAYSLRCMPQVHGATRDALEWVRSVVVREANSVTDNPSVFFNASGELELLSGGNFHGQPIALALDLAAIAVAELGNISERRVEQLVNPALSTGLTPFLAKGSGLHSGFMIRPGGFRFAGEARTRSCVIQRVSTPSRRRRARKITSAWEHQRAQTTRRRDQRAQLPRDRIDDGSRGIDQRRPLRASTGVEAAYSCCVRR